VIGGGELALKAKDVADLVITPDELGAIADDKKQAKKIANSTTYFIAEAPLMAVVGKRLGTVLGPRGKMPKPIAPGADPTAMIEGLRKSVSIRTKDRMTFHAPVGTAEMTAEQIADNIELILKRVESKLEKGQHNIASAYVKTTMGPSEKIM
jgi:large subunit ribosomal protein L1